MEKIVKESLDESLNYGGHVYDVIKVGNDKIKAGKEGILGDKGQLIPWNIVKVLLKKYSE
jgi:hypothetical protein